MPTLFLLFQSNLRKDIDALYTKKHKFSAKEIEQIEQNVAINNERRERFEATINHFFADSDKVLGIEEDFIFILNNELPLPVTALSSGEKQLLLILLKVFLENEQPSLLLLDEPEISLHTYWQRELLTQIRNINPHCQLLVVTHSGSLLGRGWMENFVRIEEIVFPYRTKNANISPLTIRNNEKMKRIISELNSFKGKIFERSSLFNEFLKKEKDFNAKEASELLEALRTEGIIPNRLTYLELIKKMEWTEAKSFLVNIGEDIYYLNLMLKKAPNFSISIKFFEETTKNSLKPDIKLDIILFNTLFSKTTNLAECLKLEALRKAYNIPVDELYKQKLSFKNIPLTI